jgi:DNA (cytosine-5)-methyltransferase 1
MPARRNEAVYRPRVCENTTFPNNWTFEGSIAQQYKQIGNAVPVNLGTELGYSLVKFLNQYYRSLNPK